MAVSNAGGSSPILAEEPLGDVSFCIFYRLQPKRFSKLLQRDALRSDRDVLFRPSQSDIGRFLGNVVQRTFPRFYPDALEARTERYIDFFIFPSP